MLNRLPGWVWFGSGVLSAVAGFVNAIGFLGYSHQGLTHVSGTASSLGIELATGRGGRLGDHAAVLACFVAGAVLSSVIVRDTHLQLGRRYGVALLAEACLLGLSLFLLSQGVASGVLLLAAAAGLQNAMASTFSGAIVRTTHVTGIFTDIGIALGNALRGQRLDIRKLTLLGTIAAGFILGSAAGALQFDRQGYQSLWTPTTLTGLGGLSYLVYRYWNRYPRAEKGGKGDKYERHQLKP